MSQIIDLYNKIYSLVDEINKKLSLADDQISNIRSSKQINIPARIERLEELLEKIDDYELRIKGFQELAKKNLSSGNVLTIEAPPGYRVNLNRLKKWALMIDPSSDNDPYAQRLLAVAKCDECFLEKKRKEFKERIEALRNDQSLESDDEVIALEKKRHSLIAELDEIADGDEIKGFAQALNDDFDSRSYRSAPESFHNKNEDADIELLVGEIGYPFFSSEKSNNSFAELFRDHYSEKTKTVFLPFNLPINEEFVISVTCSPSRSRQFDYALQNLLLQQIDNCIAGTRKIYFLDAVKYNSNSIGGIRKLENSFVMEQIPRNPEQLTGVLEQIVSTFGDVDELIDIKDSIREYNRDNSKKALPYSTLVLLGWPNSFSARDRELVNRIIINYERYGFSIISVSYQSSEKQSDMGKTNLPEYALFNAYTVKMLAKSTTIKLPGEENERRFKWCSFEGELKDEFINSLKNNAVISETTGNDYLKRYDMTVVPTYSRGKKPIVLPFGVDGKDQEQSISFDKNNFAAYLIGDSGSGKSTLIHTIIAGILRGYHPDDVELWLADFKQVEFKQYIDHMPPHVKYILLDESHELVYDLIDKLNDEMLARQLLLARLGKEKVEEIEVGKDIDKPVPIIFVIMDEFSIMSQAIDADQSYRLKLQNLLAKGRALGFKFLFASQKFTSGVTGLTATAKDQIQQRISMKAPKDEINEVLALSPGLRTEKVRNWIDAIPPYYALIKRRIDDDTLEVNRMKVMYFSDGYELRDRMIDGISSKMKKVDKLDVAEINSYVDKDPVIVDGNSFDAFNIDKINKGLDHADKDDGDIVLTLGTPRLMSKIKPVVLSVESRENVLLVGRSTEQACVSSIIMTVCKIAKCQHAGVSIWSYERNRLFKQYRDVFEREGLKIIVGMESICHEIESVRGRLKDGTALSEIIVMLGMDRICGDFEYSGEMNTSFQLYSNERSEEEQKSIDAHSLKMAKFEICSKIQREGRAEGKSEEEIVALKKAAIEELEKEAGVEKEEKPAAKPSDVKLEEKKDKTQIKPAEAFKEIVRNGSRQGVHFVLCINSMSDFRAIGLRQELFRHKLAFQLSEDDSIVLFGKKIASQLSEHVCLYDDSYERYSFRPFLHKEVVWDGWSVNDENEAVSPLNS